MNLCECGCGQKVKRRFVSGHNTKLRKHTVETKAKMSDAHKSKKLSDKTKEKLSLLNKGKKMSLESRQKMSDFHKGTTLSMEVRQKISDSCKGDNPVYGKFWRTIRGEIIRADKYTCQADNCKGNSYNLIVHHIDSNKYNNCPTNLVTLCMSCHKLLHNGHDIKLIDREEIWANQKLAKLINQNLTVEIAQQ